MKTTKGQINRIRVRGRCVISFLLIVSLFVCMLPAAYAGEIPEGEGMVRAEADAPLVPMPGDETFDGMKDEQIIDQLTEEPEKDAEYDGYIVTMADKSDVDKKAMNKTADDVIDSATAVISDPSDALDFTDAENIRAIEPNYKLTAFVRPDGKLYADNPSDGIEWKDIDTGGADVALPTGEMPIVGAQTIKFPDSDPADPVYRDQNNYQWGLKSVNASAAWRVGYRGKGVTVAVLDTGINVSHEDFDSGRIISAQRFFSSVNGTSYADDNGHGTYVTSIISASTNNMPNGKGRGMAGIADEVSLIEYKVLGKAGEGYVSDLINAYNALLSSNVDVVNMSFGHPGYLAREDEVIQQLIAKGVIIIAAAGNDGNAEGAAKNQICYPANYENVIGVGSSRSDGGVSTFSSKNQSVDVAAPGENMAGLSFNSGDSYKVGGDGTSFAAPVISAAAAIARQIKPGITANEFMELLKSTVTDAGPKGYDTSFGYGILNIEKIVKTLDPNADIEDNVSLLIKFNANKGEVTTKNKAVFKGKKYGKLPKATRKGYTFKGWYTKKSGGKKLTASSKVSFEKNSTLYAQWKKKKK